jgi:FolB domain-containing protein
MDKITICDLEVSCCVGVTEEERANPQRLLLSVEIMRDLSTAAESDNLADTIDYFEVSQRLLELGRDRSWRLLESLALEIVTLIKNDYHATKASVEIKKFVIPQARFVSVCVTR